MKISVNAPAEQLTPLLERFAQLAVELDLAEAARADGYAAVNSIADKIVLPIVTEMDEIRAVVKPWWKRNGANLLTGKRKTVELGGCMIGSKSIGHGREIGGGGSKVRAELGRTPRSGAVRNATNLRLKRLPLVRRLRVRGTICAPPPRIPRGGASRHAPTAASWLSGG